MEIKYLKTLKVLPFILILINSTVFSQNWPIVYADNNFNYIKSVFEDYDKGLVLTGVEEKTYSGLGFGYLIKTDINGEVLWKKTFGGDDHYVGLRNGKKTMDNGFLLSGWTNKEEIDWWDPVFIKLNECGDIEWCTIISSELGSGSDFAIDAVELSDGSIIGQLRYYGHQIETIRISLMKMNEYGEPLWIKHLAQNDSTIFNEEGEELILTSDSNYLITAYAGHPYFIMSDSIGDEIWSMKWIAEGGSSGISMHTKEDIYGNFYSTAGLFGTVGHPPGPAILKTDQDGNQLYYGLILGDTIERGGAGPFVIYNDTTLIIGGSYSNVNHPVDEGSSEVFVTDTLGNLLNHRILLETYYGPYNLIKTKDGKIVVSGNYDISGGIKVCLWKMNLALEDDSLYMIPITYDSLCGHAIISDTTGLDCSVFVNIDEIPTIEEYERLLKVYPNPAYNKITFEYKLATINTTISAKLYNANGILVDEIKLPEKTGKHEYNCSFLKPGVYLYSVLIGNNLQTGKFVIAR